MRTRSEKIKFVLLFAIAYSILLAIGLSLLGESLISLELSLIKGTLATSINYNSFIFVSECSGLVAISCYLAIMIALITMKHYRNKIKWIFILYSALLLFVWNIIRIILVLLSERISFSFAQVLHIVLWFVTFLIIVWLSIKSLKKEVKKK